MSIVALTGAAGSGKSTAANILVREYGFVCIKFAAPIKTMLRAIGLTDAETEGPLKEVPSRILQGRTPRHAMQTLGTEWGRECLGPGFWTGLWEESACAALDQRGRVVVDDCRFPDEAAVVWRLGGTVIRIVRPSQEAIAASGHVSEAGIGAVVADDTLRNDGDMAQLRRLVHGLL